MSYLMLLLIDELILDILDETYQKPKLQKHLCVIVLELVFESDLINMTAMILNQIIIN